jgi:predicted nucleotidyltransferase
MAIQTTSSAMKGLNSIYGFGSFFRNEPYRDVDILAVINDGEQDCLKIYQSLHHTLTSVFQEEVVDLLLLTNTEYQTRPLKCMNELTLIWARG